jgi:hypothetical protein
MRINDQNVKNRSEPRDQSRKIENISAGDALNLIVGYFVSWYFMLDLLNIVKKPSVNPIC